MTDVFRLEGKTAVVTGAARGIGLGISRVLADGGANVVLVDMNQEQLQESASTLPAGQAETYVGDVGTAEVARGMVGAAVDKWGGLDILVCNAGITRPAMLSKMTEEQWDEVLRVNLKHVFLAMQAASAAMHERGGGSIVNISSMGAQRGTIGQVNYAAAKAGMIGLTRAGAKELARYGIRVNAIAPGTVETPMTEKILTDERFRDTYLAEIPLGRVGQPEDIGRAVRYLASDASAWVTGQVLAVNGGTYI